MNNKRQQELLHTPEGVFDHYGRDAAEYDTVMEEMLSVIHSFGYENIKTPVFEFFDVFSREIGTTPSRELYKFFDKEGNTLVLRPDFTPSVARCAAKYFMDDTNPIRFCYSGRAFVNTSNLQGKLKESYEMGAELINEGSVYADAEILASLIKSLLSTGLTRFQITLGNVDYFRGICKAAGLSKDMEAELRDVISAKNYYAAESLLLKQEVEKTYTEKFLRLTSFVRNDEDLEKEKESAPNERAKSALQRLIDVYHLLEDYGLSDYVSFDLSLLSKYHYYTGIIFKGYTYGVGDAVATGGRYDKLLGYFGKEAPAIGYMISVDTLLEALRMQKITIPVPENPVVVTWKGDGFREALSKAEALRKAGQRVILTKEED
jgi:ATP phosphoribosyltransferase regulatory subunit